MIQLGLIVLVACSGAPQDIAVDTGGPHLVVPGHDDCKPVGFEMEADVCAAVIAEDGRQPTVSQDKSGLPPVADDPRLSDPELAWLDTQVKRCTCACCHTASYGGPGVYFWDLEFAPVWLDSASRWSLSVFSGQTGERSQTLPSTDPDRLLAVVDAEIERRRAD